MGTRSDVTRLLHALGESDARVADELFQLVYGELRALAGAFFRRQRSGHTLQPTALVNEAFLKLVNQPRSAWQGRAHFLAVAARAMRQILTDHARKRVRLKRGNPLGRITWSDDVTPIADTDPQILDLDQALTELAKLDERQSRIVELRFFGGMTMEEISQVLGLSLSTVEADWRMARAWLHRQLSDDGAP
jgi:RNA polymerase sigma factor (TIGR02999 family)